MVLSLDGPRGSPLSPIHRGRRTSAVVTSHASIGFYITRCQVNTPAHYLARLPVPNRRYKMSLLTTKLQLPRRAASGLR